MHGDGGESNAQGGEEHIAHGFIVEEAAVVLQADEARLLWPEQVKIGEGNAQGGEDRDQLEEQHADQPGQDENKVDALG